MTGFQNWLQKTETRQKTENRQKTEKKTENRQKKENKQTVVFIELLPQLKIMLRSMALVFVRA